jgi:hypothetical protein
MKVGNVYPFPQKHRMTVFVLRIRDKEDIEERLAPWFALFMNR